MQFWRKNNISAPPLPPLPTLVRDCLEPLPNDPTPPQEPTVLNPGDTFTKHYTIHPGHTVRDIFPEAGEFADMPDVFTTGCLVALMEWSCIEQLSPHLDSGQISLGIAMNMTHDGPCTTGTELDIHCEVTAASARRASWNVEVRTSRGGVLMGTATHTRAIVDRATFSSTVDRQVATIGGQYLEHP